MVRIVTPELADKKVLLVLSGGVDSSVVAAMDKEKAITYISHDGDDGSGYRTSI
ncbi:asparagine synthase-related protein [Lachnospiraceae bacterium SGI.066]|nr:asparagine synthase-related protein [Clostridia bacterium]MDY5497155.1 asparagine synthase-related protein [Anaerobutyricum sp.]